MHRSNFWLQHRLFQLKRQTKKSCPVLLASQQPVAQTLGSNQHALMTQVLCYTNMLASASHCVVLRCSIMILHSKCTGQPLLCQSQLRALCNDNDSTIQTSATPSHQPPANQVLACPVLRLARSWCHFACNEARHKVACKH